MNDFNKPVIETMPGSSKESTYVVVAKRKGMSFGVKFCGSGLLFTSVLALVVRLRVQFAKGCPTDKALAESEFGFQMSSGSTSSNLGTALTIPVGLPPIEASEVRQWWFHNKVAERVADFLCSTIRKADGANAQPMIEPLLLSEYLEQAFEDYVPAPAPKLMSEVCLYLAEELQKDPKKALSHFEGAIKPFVPDPKKPV